MRRWWPYLAVAAACAAAGFWLGPVLARLRPAPVRPAVAWTAEADYEGYRRPSRRDERWRENRGHAFSFKDREETLESEDPRWARIYAGAPRLRPRPDGCLPCHAAEAQRPLGCGDCHEGQSAGLRITRPALAYRGSGSQQELRALVCGQCHGEYYFEDGQAKHPWSRGLGDRGYRSALRRHEVPRLGARRDGRAGDQGAAPAVRDVEPGDSCAERGGVRRLPHAGGAARGDAGYRPPRGAAAGGGRGRVRDVSCGVRRRDEGARGG